MVSFRHCQLGISICEKRLGKAIARLNGLLFPLLVSCLLHGSAILLLYAGNVSGTKGGEVAGADIRQSVLKATLNYPESVVEVNPLATETESGKRSYETSENTRPKATPRLSPKEWPNQLRFPRVNYYATNELTVQPQPMGEPVLDPSEYVNIVVPGKIVLVLWINDQGEIVDVSIESSDLPDAFSKAIVRAFRKLLFVPGELNGQKVGAVIRVEVSNYDGRGHSER